MTWRRDMAKARVLEGSTFFFTTLYPDGAWKFAVLHYDDIAPLEVAKTMGVGFATTIRTLFASWVNLVKDTEKFASGIAPEDAAEGYRAVKSQLHALYFTAAELLAVTGDNTGITYYMAKVGIIFLYFLAKARGLSVLVREEEYRGVNILVVALSEDASKRILEKISEVVDYTLEKL